jgi:transposase
MSGALIRLNALSRKFARQDILLVLDGAPNNHRCSDLVLPGNISLLFLPPYSPELNPKENLEEIREKDLQELRAQINRRRARQAQGGNPSYRMP